ncbi:MAG: glycosyltransferase [Flavobacteriaceae bacterium]|jgi:glycosyltransferase involved in cell wall biosynthesis|nr:glycosyltransferase [Flavobacteriaceae bacterium]
MISPDISVVMSVFNAEKYLAKAVNSILNQTFTNFEFIIVEDCSTDGSLKILEDFAQKDSRIKIIRKDKNKGTKGFIENLNRGLEEAKGKYIARMDADDISELERFEKQFDFLEKHPDIFIVGAQLDLMDETEKIIGEKIAETSNRLIYKKMIKNIQLFHPLIMFRNLNVHYREKMWYCEDYDLYLRIMTENLKMANLPDKLLKYRVLKSSISRKDHKLTAKLFLEKAFVFHLERIKIGKDSYDGFDTESVVKIMDFDYPSKLEDLKFAAKVCLKYGFKDSLKLILQKSKKYFPRENFGFYKFITSLSGSIFSVYSRFYTKFN